MATMAPAPPKAPPTLTVGGVRRRTFLVVALVVLFVLSSVIVAVSWISNYAPLTVDNTKISVRPPDLILKQFDATSPDGDSFMEFHLAHEPGRTFSFVFYIHNDGPLPVTLTDVSLPLAPAYARSEDVTLGPVAPGDGHPTRTVPYVIPAHGYAELTVHGRFTGCLPNGNGTFFGSVPVTYELFGFVQRHSEVEMPMTISIRGQPGAHC